MSVEQRRPVFDPGMAPAVGDCLVERIDRGGLPVQLAPALAETGDAGGIEWDFGDRAKD